MQLKERTKGKFHLLMLSLAAIMGAYNARRNDRKNKFLAVFYGIVVGVEILCVIDHASEEA